MLRSLGSRWQSEEKRKKRGGNTIKGGKKWFNISLKLKLKAGVESTKSVEDLVDSVLFSDLQDVECLAWWQKMEPSLVAKGPAGVALVALAQRWNIYVSSTPTIKTLCQGTWLRQPLPQQWSVSSLLQDWSSMPRGANWIRPGLTISSSCARLSCLELVNWSGSNLCWLQPHAMPIHDGLVVK